MPRLLGLLGLFAAALLTLSACASSSDAPPPVPPQQQPQQPTAYTAGQPSSSTASADESESDPPAINGQIADSGRYAGLLINRNVIGDPSAPVVITEYSDFL